MNSSKDLSNVELQIISKYLDYNDLNKLLKLSDDLKYNYHTTFEFIDIPANYVMPIHQIKKIINNLKLMFPNLEEIILNFISDNKFINTYDFNKILLNYINFHNVINLKYKMKIRFNKALDFILNYKDIISYVKLFLLYISKILDENCKIYIYILHLFYFNMHNKFNVEYYKTIFEMIEKYPNINFVININKLQDFYDLCDYIDDEIFICKLKNLYITFNYDKELYFQINNIDKEKENRINKYLKFRRIFAEIPNFPRYYNIMKLKNKLKSTKSENAKVYDYYNNKCDITINELKHIVNKRYINRIYNSKMCIVVIDNQTYYTFNYIILCKYNNMQLIHDTNNVMNYYVINNINATIDNIILNYIGNYFKVKSYYNI